MDERLLMRACDALTEAFLGRGPIDASLQLGADALGGQALCIVAQSSQGEIFPRWCSTALGRDTLEGYAHDFALLGQRESADVRTNGDWPLYVTADVGAPFRLARFLVIAFRARTLRRERYFLALLREETTLGDETRSAFGRLAMHVRHCIIMDETMRSVRTERELFAAGLNHALFGFALVNPTGAIVFANASAERTLSTEQGLSSVNGLLTIADSTARAIIQARLAGAEDGPAIARVPRPNGERPFLVMLTAELEHGGTTEGPFMLFILDGAERAYSPEQFWRVLFRLSPGENAVARALVEGRNPRQIAEWRGVTEATVRAQIKRIYDKLGVRNQSQAVAVLINTSPVEAIPPPEVG